MLDLKVLKSILEQLEQERKIPKAKIIDAIEQALAAAYKKDFGKRGQIIRAEFDEESGKTEFYQVKIVVDETLARMPEPEGEEAEPVEIAEDDERFRFDPEKHILLEDAKKIKGDAELEDEIVFPLEAEDDFGRIAAQTAKQVIIQRIREAEKDSIMDEYATRAGTIVSGVVQKAEGPNVFVDFNRATGVLPSSEQIPGEFYRTGQRIKAYLTEVQETARGIHLRLSRSHPRFIEELFRLESPEIASGTVEMKSIAREPGSRSKIAVWSHDENVDPIGACVGQKGIRVTTVMSELGGEKIDIIPWSPETADFVASSLSPAKVIGITIDEESHTAAIEVTDDQLSLAIGKGGQNVRLAAKLTGWRIDIQGIEGEEADPEDLDNEPSDVDADETVEAPAEDAKEDAVTEETAAEGAGDETNTEEETAPEAEAEEAPVEESEE